MILFEIINTTHGSYSFQNRHFKSEAVFFKSQATHFERTDDGNRTLTKDMRRRSFDLVTKKEKIPDFISGNNVRLDYTAGHVKAT